MRNAKSAPAKSGSAQIVADYGKLPRTFEANSGQFDRRIRFASRGRGYSVYFTRSGAMLALTDPRGLPANRRKGAALHPMKARTNVATRPAQRGIIGKHLATGLKIVEVMEGLIYAPSPKGVSAGAEQVGFGPARETKSVIRAAT